MPSPHTQIHVKNLQANLPLSTDAWGRPSKSQPVLISVSVSLHQPFTSSSSTDTVASSTVHYGVLSKSILKFCDNLVAESKSAGDEYTSPRRLEAFVAEMRDCLYSPVGVLELNAVESLRIKVFLPKGSLLGSGVGLEKVFEFEGESIETRHSNLSLKDLKIPCIIGVNPHEREAKQIVIANVVLEEWNVDNTRQDNFVKFERAVVEAISNSSFQTLEAMTTRITEAVIKDFLAQDQIPEFPRIGILLEKPTAVTWADAPGVEVLVESNPKLNPSVKEFWGNFLDE